MEQAFWLMWKALTPILAVTVVVLLFERRQQRRRADGLWQSIVAYRNEKYALAAKLATAQLEVRSLRDKADTTESVLTSMRTLLHSDSIERAKTRQRIAYLTERNEQLTLNALVDGVKFIKINTN